MDIKLWRYSKRKNSTNRPNNNMAVIMSGELRDNTSIINPVIAFRSSGVYNFNYAYIPLFARYYYINDWQFIGGLWQASMSVDVLATARDLLYSSTQYVTRSASSRDGALMDTAYPITTNYTVKTYSTYMYGSTLGSSYVVGIVGQGNTTGVVDYYAFSAANFEAFANKLLGDFINNVQSGITEISEDLTKVLFNPLQYIVSCRWYPIDLSIGSASRTISLGWWTVTANCLPLTNSTLIRTYSKGLIWTPHPLADSRGAYLNFAPYTEYFLTLKPFAAQIPLKCGGSTVNLIEATVKIDIASGGAVLTVTNNYQNPDASFSTRTLATINASLGADVPMAQISADVYRAAGQALQLAGDVGGKLSSGVLRMASGGIVSGASAVIGAVGLAATGICDVASAASPDVSMVGSVGDRSNTDNMIELMIIYHDVANNDPEHIGQPLMRRIALKNLSGFTMCANPDFKSDGTKSEDEMINRYLTEGCFLDW